MARILSFSFFAFLCLGITLLITLVIIFALRRGTRKINDQVEDLASRQPRRSRRRRATRLCIHSRDRSSGRIGFRSDGLASHWAR